MMSNTLYISNGINNEINDLHQLLHCIRIARQISVLTNNYCLQYNIPLHNITHSNIFIIDINCSIRFQIPRLSTRY